MTGIDRDEFIGKIYKRTKSMNPSEREFVSLLIESLNNLYEFEPKQVNPVFQTELIHTIKDLELMINYTTTVLKNGTHNGT